MRKITLVSLAAIVIAIAALVAVFALPKGLAPMTRELQVEIFHQDSWARPAGVEAGLPHDKNVVTSYVWRPNGLYVFKGDTVVLKVVNNAGKRSHSFVLPEYGLDTGRMLPKSEKTLTFVADKAGVFKFFCGLPHNHDVDPGDCASDHAYQYGFLIVLER